MAKKKAEVIEVEEPVLVEEVQEAEQVEIEVVPNEVILEEPKAPLITPTEAPKITEEVIYNPKDIVEFYNLKGELRYAPYAYITKRGYTALRKYTKKK